MTKTEIAAIRARCEAASPWNLEFFNCDKPYGMLVRITWDDVKFISSARKDIPAPLTALGELQAECNRWKDRYNVMLNHLSLQ